MKNILKNWKTTLAGVVSILLIVLVNSGVIQPEDSQNLGVGANELINHIDGVIAAVLSIALIFSKDADVKDNQENENPEA